MDDFLFDLTKVRSIKKPRPEHEEEKEKPYLEPIWKDASSEYHHVRFELIYRSFAKPLIHEHTFRYVGQHKESFNPWGDVPGRCATERLAAFLQNGWPNPKPAGAMELFETRPERNIYKVSIYCDDMFICPTCGEFHLQSPTEDESPWLVDVGLFLLVDHVAIQQVIERRRAVAEFSFAECGRENCAADRARVIEGMKQQEVAKARTAAFNAELVNLTPPPLSASFSKHSSPKKAYVYAIGGVGGVKIGNATSVKKRIFSLQSGSPIQHSIINAWEHHDAPRMERLLHRKYREFRISREWFRLNEEQIQSLRDANRIEELLDAES